MENFITGWLLFVAVGKEMFQEINEIYYVASFALQKSLNF